MKIIKMTKIMDALSVKLDLHYMIIFVMLSRKFTIKEKWRVITNNDIE